MLSEAMHEIDKAFHPVTVDVSDAADLGQWLPRNMKVSHRHLARGCPSIDLAYAKLQPDCAAKIIPDSIYIGWPKTGLSNFTAAVERAAFAALHPPRKQLCGWTGWLDNSQRKRAFSIMRQNATLFEAASVICSHAVFNPTTMHLCLSLEEQVSRWACLVDIRGIGWSARVPMILHSGRPLLYVERNITAFYNVRPHAIQAWEHYIPVRADLSDLNKQAHWVLQNPEQSQAIAERAQALARAHFTYEAAVATLARTLRQHINSRADDAIV